MLKTTKDERLLKIQALQDELKILNEDTGPPEQIEDTKPPEQIEEGDDAIQKPKKRSN